jgi:hypothetical protein
MMPLFKSIYDGQKFFFMSLKVNIDKKKLKRMETNWMKKLSFLGCESKTPNA